jgi:hypothetical protein
MIHQTNNKSITAETRNLVEALAVFADRSDVVEALKATHRVATDKLQADSASSAAVETLELEVFTDVPAEVGTIRVAVIREGFDGGFERHSNSTQVLLSLDGSGETHVHTGQGWRVDRYGKGANLEDRWHVVPQAVWHKSAAPGPGNWTVVAFHTARDVQDEFVDERPA